MNAKICMVEKLAYTVIEPNLAHTHVVCQNGQQEFLAAAVEERYAGFLP